ncbi:diguanylate cyclase (GGDEF)-like protein [Sphingomonas sp. BE138]|uniref:putative bifunctional diguanylate cyclase/phosphodiesterase n=1 Tax=Sphingomonas sp. BE138 TaxID=2817845 RepID=UPI0028645C37|nr:bifunctional diguanylate cyclase/phosphodiesterase [Sphingomonas sp. BE138]MDR6787643.1 diguanylate cyclase (GGDEF)-like protein [Sphingomonas sp. BE138]
MATRATWLARRTATHPDSHTLSVEDGALELVPIPLALVVVVPGESRIEMHNRAFARARLTDEPQIMPLVEAFLASGSMTEERDWQTGATVERRHYRVNLSRLLHRGRPSCIVSFVDQTAEVRTEETLRREMATDSLTGLPNRSGFTDALEASIAAATPCWAVLMIDLERFSRFNACLGSLVGDELLITVARRIKGALRHSDTLARTGGDEFGVLLSIDADREEVDQVARRIRDALATPFRLGDYELRVSCAIGIAFGDAEVADPEDVIRHAQVAMKKSKATKNAESYQTRALDSARAEFAMETALRRAIEGERLNLVYQPICDLATGRVNGFEALARWTDEYGVRHEPSRFIPVAEESGLIVPLGRWALDRAVRTLAEWDERAGGFCGVTVAVNLSPIQLQRDSIPGIVQRALHDSGVAGERLKLEITESALIADPDRIARVLTGLKKLGVTIAMDDFGTGFSNLASLQKLPIDVLKIDRSFVTGLLTDRDKVAIVRAILGLSQALGMATVAEGIEANEVGQTLAALGCTFGQGYAYARPLDPEDAYAFLRERNA